MPAARIAAAALVLLAWAFSSSQADARPARDQPGTHTPAPARAPSGPPLTSGSASASAEEASSSAAPSGGDPLVGNGMGSPMCEDRAGAELSTPTTRNCRTSGFEAAQAPTGNYAFDVHINTGLLGANSDTLEQDYLISPVWMALVWIVHALIVALEWCFTIDLLNSSAMSGVASALRSAQAVFTQPWLVMALAIAAVLALYNGLIRRRVAETLGQALLMVAMMVGGLWVIANPTGTVGALGQLANQASLGTLGAVAGGTPAHPARTLGDSMRGLFNGVVAAPWCYMEFGDVEWCSNPARLDPRLHTAGLKIAASELAKVGCKSSAPSLSPSMAKELGLPVCVTPGSTQAKALNQSAELLRGAHTNGELFLALPANGPARNSINESSSLFHVLCGGDEEPCKGPTAAQAEFRTRSGTASRLGGLFLIVIGALGMALLIGFIALHLLSAAIISLFYLLLAPAAVIAPALGDGGRAAFRGWVRRLLGAVTAKLLYSFMLGIVLLLERTLMRLPGFGWWTQWLLLSVLWWGAFRHRRDVLGLGTLHHGESSSHEHGIGGLRLASRLMAARELGRMGGMVRRKLSPPPPSAEKRARVAAAARGRAKEIEDNQAGRSLEHDYREAQADVGEAPALQARISSKQARLDRLRHEHAAAQDKAQTAKEAGELAYSDFTLFQPPPERDRAAAKYGAEEASHKKRAAKLQDRMDRLQGEITTEQSSLTAARQTVAGGERAKRASGNVYTREQSEERARFLAAQAALPGRERDYAGLAGLAGYGRREYEGLDAGFQRAARLEVDRELAMHKAANTTAGDVAAGGMGSLRRREQRKLSRGFDNTVKQQVGAGGHDLPSSARPKTSSIDSHLQESRARSRAKESSVVRDAREVQAHRRRQLGRE
ncbi:MAG TPA: hypothetical protein VMU55_08320 [Solirubrobacteraceae bacterium]|nr:hypothetical protein [Solirubrobacteraceae bacterium]